MAGRTFFLIGFDFLVFVMQYIIHINLYVSFLIQFQLLDVLEYTMWSIEDRLQWNRDDRTGRWSSQPCYLGWIDNILKPAWKCIMFIIHILHFLHEHLCDSEDFVLPPEASNLIQQPWRFGPFPDYNIN